MSPADTSHHASFTAAAERWEPELTRSTRERRHDHAAAAGSLGKPGRRPAAVHDTLGEQKKRRPGRPSRAQAAFSVSGAEQGASAGERSGAKERTPPSTSAALPASLAGPSGVSVAREKGPSLASDGYDKEFDDGLRCAVAALEELRSSFLELRARCREFEPGRTRPDGSSVTALEAEAYRSQASRASPYICSPA